MFILCFLAGLMDAYSHSADSDSDDCDSCTDKPVKRVDEVVKIRDVHGKQRASYDDGSKIEEKNKYEEHSVFSSSSKMIDFSSSNEESGGPESSKESLRKVYALAMSLPVSLFFSLS